MHADSAIVNCTYLHRLLCGSFTELKDESICRLMWWLHATIMPQNWDSSGEKKCGNMTLKIQRTLQMQLL